MQPLACLEDNLQSYTGAKPNAVVCSEIKWLSSAALTLEMETQRNAYKIEDFTLEEYINLECHGLSIFKNGSGFY